MEGFDWPTFALAIVGVVLLMLFLGSFFTVSTAQVAVITRFGKFLRVAEPGLNWKWPFIDSVAGRISLRVNHLALTISRRATSRVDVRAAAVPSSPLLRPS